MSLTAAPNINTKIPFSKINTSIVERLMMANQEFLRALTAEEYDRQRLYDNFRMYWGVDYGQWNPEVVQQLLDESRHPITINLVSQKINVLAGAITSNQFEIDFVPINGENSSLTTAFKDVYLSDKNIMKHDQSYIQCSKFGLIYQGVEQLYVDRTFDPEGNLAYHTMQPGFVVFTPDWKTDYVQDCEKAWVFAYMNEEQIARKYGMQTAELRQEIALNKAIGQYFDTTRVDLGKGTAPKHTNLKRVVELHEIISIDTTRLVDYSKGMNGLPFPVMDPKKDKEYLIRWGNVNNVNWEYVTEVPYKDKLLKILTFCPEISFNKAFENKASEIQIKRLDLFPWSADRLNGKNRGIIDITRDIQQTINKHQSQKTHMINSAANGGTIFNENLFGGDAAKMERLKQDKNRPDYVEDADLDGIEKTHLVLKDQPYDSALFTDERLMIDMLDLVTPVPAAMSSRAEGREESGILYQSKIAIAEIGMKTLYEGLKQHQLDKAHAYYLQAQNTYRNTYRKFRKADKSGFIEMNKEVEFAGGTFILNSIADLPRCHIIVKQSPHGLINRHMNRIQYTEMMNGLPQDLGLIRSWLAIKVAKTMETNEEETRELDMIATMEMMKAAMVYKTEIINMTANQKQAEMMIAQVDSQLGAIMGELAGAPVEEAPQALTPTEEMPVTPPEGVPLPTEMTETPELSLQERPLALLEK